MTPPPAVDLSQVKVWIDALAADKRAYNAEPRDRDERIYADEKAIAASYHQDLTAQMTNMSHTFAAQQKGADPFGFLKNRTLIEALVGLAGAFAVFGK